MESTFFEVDIECYNLHGRCKNMDVMNCYWSDSYNHWMICSFQIYTVNIHSRAHAEGPPLLLWKLHTVMIESTHNSTKQGPMGAWEDVSCMFVELQTHGYVM